LATVIDSLLIELGLDSSKFDKAQKKSVDELRKFDEANQKTSKNIQRSSKETALGFEKARDSLISFGVAAFGASAFVSFVSTMTAGNAALGRNSQLLSLSARELDAWGGVLKSVGGTADDFQGSLQALQAGVAGIKLGNAAILTPLARLGALGSVDINKGTVDILKLSEALKKFRETNGEQLTYSLAQQLGIDKNTFMVLMQGEDAVRKLYDASYKVSGVNEKNTASAQKLQAQFGALVNTLGGVKNSIMDEVYPALGLLATGAEVGAEKFIAINKATDGWVSNTLLLGGAMGSLNLALKAIGVTVSTGAFALVGKLFGAVGLLLHSGNLGENQEDLDAQLLRDLKSSSGGGSRSFRNKNPGNMKYGDFAKEHGATGEDKGGFAIFPNMETGASAQTALINQKEQKGLNTLRKLIYGSGKTPGWLGSGDDLKDAPSYLADLTKKTGINPDQILLPNQTETIRKAQEMHEGMTGPNATAPMGSAANTTTNTVDIQNVNVHTQATDPNMIANSIGTALKNNSLINAGIVGNR
jgi:hypothetical protein